MEEKNKHKKICSVAAKCSHDIMYTKNCYFIDANYVESDDEENDVDESDDEICSEKETEWSSTNEMPKTVPNNNAVNVTLKAKVGSGLNMHMKTDNKIKCDTCGFKTTTTHFLRNIVKSFMFS